MRLIDKLVDIIYKLCLTYKNKRRIEELRKRDPFIYN
jgi:hypothetical protein